MFFIINLLNTQRVEQFVKKLSDLGERKAIQLITSILTQDTSVVGLGDDCAAIDLGKEYLLITTDMISEKNHIPQEMRPFQIGWFLCAINLSDIAAKGGTPLGLVVSLGLPTETSEQFLKELSRGLNTCATRFGTTIVGGDTKETREITLSGTAFGRVNKNEFMARRGAQIGDVVAVTGTLGKAGAGYYALRHNITDRKICRFLFEPWPRLNEGRILAQTHHVTSCMDLSDGLSSSLYQLQEMNQIGVEIDQGKLPISPELRSVAKKIKNLDVPAVSLHFGGDYELLVTIPPTVFEKTKKAVGKKGVSLYPIGTVTKTKKILLYTGSDTSVLENKGYEHFKKNITW
ncbi:MAG: thiamine-phosphate kinase [Candidatus Thermoplasmatota archaeon]